MSNIVLKTKANTMSFEERVSSHLAAAKNLLISSKPSDGPMIRQLLTAVDDGLDYCRKIHELEFSDLPTHLQEDVKFFKQALKAMNRGWYDILPLSSCDNLDELF